MQRCPVNQDVDTGMDKTGSRIKDINKTIGDFEPRKESKRALSGGRREHALLQARRVVGLRVAKRPDGKGTSSRACLAATPIFVNGGDNGSLKKRNRKREAWQTPNITNPNHDLDGLRLVAQWH